MSNANNDFINTYICNTIDNKNTLSNDTKNNIILYARISSNNTDQFPSLNNQISKLQYLHPNLQIIFDIKSVKNGITAKLKNIIKEKNNKIQDLTIIIKTIDRLTRSLNDLQFIKSNIRFIRTYHDNKIYDTTIDEDCNLITSAIIASQMELSCIMSRSLKDNNIIKNIVGKKRSAQNDDVYYLENITKKIKRENYLKNLILNLSINSNNFDENKFEIFFKNLEKLIIKSQNLNCLKDWIYISRLSVKLKGKYILDDYNKSNYEKKSLVLKKSDIVYYVKNILENNRINIDTDDKIIINFINVCKNKIKINKINNKLIFVVNNKFR